MATPTPAATPPEAPEADCHEHAGHGYITAKDDYLKRLKRIEGQARGLQRMVDAAVAGGPEADAKIKEATDAIARLVRS